MNIVGIYPMTRKILLIVIFVYIGVSFFIAFIFKQSQPKNGQSSAVVVAPTSAYPPSDIPYTRLYFVPDPVYIDPNGTVPMKVVIDSKENNVTSVKLEIGYDPKVLQFVSIDTDSVLYGKEVFIKKIDEDNGIITFGAGISSVKGEIPIKASNEAICKVIFRPINLYNKETKVRLLPGSRVNAEGIKESALVGTKDITVNLTKLNQSQTYEQD